MTVLDATGAPVDVGDAGVDPGDATRMTVSWRLLSDGVYTVSLGSIIVRWVTYLAAAALTGGALFSLAVWRSIQNALAAKST